MRIGLMLVAAIVAVSSFGQGLLPWRSLGGARLARSSDSAEEFKEKYPEGTNEFGRTFEQEKNFRTQERSRTLWRTRFLHENPSGKNRFQRSSDEEYEFEETFDIDTFLGFELGKDIGNAKTVKLAKPYRLFDWVNLSATAKGRLYKITLEKGFKNASFASLSNEIQKLVANIEKTYKTPMTKTGGSGSMLSSYLFGYFHGRRLLGVGPYPKVAFEVSGNYDLETGFGTIRMGVCKPKMYDADREQSEAERRAKLEAGQRDVSLPDDAGAELLTSRVSNVSETSADDHEVARVAERQAQAEQEKAQREAERAEQRQQLLAIQEELKRVREAKALAARGDGGGLLELLAQYKGETARRQKEYSDLANLSGEAAKMSQGAKALYEADLAEAKVKADSALKSQKELEAKLTPEKIAEEKRKQAEDAARKAQEAKDKAEYEEFKRKFKVERPTRMMTSEAE